MRTAAPSRTIAAFSLAGLTLAPVSIALEPVESPPAVEDEISVELVNLEVHATDRDGRPVADLPRGSFRLFEDGRPIEISHFSWIESGDDEPRRDRPGASVTSNGVAPPPRQIALFFDELQIGNRDRAPLLASLQRALGSRLASDDRVSVVRFDGAELELVLPWSKDREKLGRALEQLGSVSVRRISAGLELKSWLDLLERDIRINGGAGAGCPDAGVILRGYADLVRRNVQHSAAALLRYANRLAHEPGQKIMIHVSDGIPFVAGGEAYQYAIEMCDCSALAQGIANAGCVAFDSNPSNSGETRDRFDPQRGRLEMSEYTMAPLWKDVSARVNALGVTVYTLQIAEAGGQFLPDDGLQMIPAATRAMAEQNPVDTIDLLARETGGILARGGRGIEDEVGRLVAGIEGYYSLAFRPERGGRNAVRRLELEVDRPGVDLRYRRSYRLSSREERIAAQLAELFDADSIDNPLALAVSLRAGADGASPPRLRVVVPFERLSLIDSVSGGQEGRFTVFVAVRPPGGDVSIPRQRTIVARRGTIETASFTYEVALPERAGDVAVAVVDDFSGAVAYAREALDTH